MPFDWIRKLKHLPIVVCFSLCGGTILSTNGRFYFLLRKMCIFFRSAIAFIKEHSPLGQTSPSFKNNPLCHRFKTWALNRKFDFYWSNYSSSASPLAFVPCSKPCRQSSTSYSALLKQRCQWLSFSEGDSLPQKEESKRYSLHGLLNNPFSITCVFENTQ